jgi:hypothetical protein
VVPVGHQVAGGDAVAREELGGERVAIKQRVAVAGEGPGAGLDGAIAVKDAAAGDAAARVSIEGLRDSRQAVVQERGVGVQQADDRRSRELGDAAVGSGGETKVGSVRDHRDGGKALADGADRTIQGGVVHNHGRGEQPRCVQFDGGETAEQEVAAFVRDDDDAEVHDTASR